MKRIIALMLALALAMSMAACGKGAEPTAATTTAPSDPTTAPSDPTTAPTDAATEPSAPASAPSNPTTAPSDPTTAPSDPTTAPSEESTAPTQAPEKEGLLAQDSYSVSDYEAVANRDMVVATVGDGALTNGVLQVYYWMDVYNFLGQYGAYAIYYGLDYTKPLDEQACSMLDGTWQHYFLANSLDMWFTYEAMAQRAARDGVPVDEETLQLLDSMEEDLEASRVELGYATVDEMIQADVGPGATAADFLAYQSLYYRSYSYYNYLINNTTFTDIQVEAWFDQNKETLAQSGITKDTMGYDVRHILIGVADTKTDADWENCRAAAQTLLDQWLAGEATEESFAALAQTHSTDTGSASNGGLYTDLTKDTNFVEPFKQWYLDESREVGHYGLVKSDYGYHIMYFSGSGLIWPDYCRNAMTQESVSQQMEAITNAAQADVDYEKIALAVVDLNREEEKQ